MSSLTSFWVALVILRVKLISKLEMLVSALFQAEPEVVPAESAIASVVLV